LTETLHSNIHDKYTLILIIFINTAEHTIKQTL